MSAARAESFVLTMVAAGSVAAGVAALLRALAALRLVTGQ